MSRRKKRRGQARSIQNPAVPITGEKILEYLGGERRSSSGVYVTPRRAIGCSPVWQSLDLVSGDIARLPFEVRQANQDGRGSKVAKQHPLYRVLSRWNGESTPDIWLTRMVCHAMLYGNAYTEIIRRGTRVLGLRWLRRDQVEPMWENGEYYYLVAYDTNKDATGKMGRVEATDMLHVQGLTMDEFGGLSLVDYARNTFGRYLAAEGFTGDFFANNATPSGFFETPEELSLKAIDRFLSQMENRHRGIGRQFRIAVLEKGMKYNPIGVNPKDALLIDLLNFSVEDVARFFNIPPHKLGSDKKVSYNSLEQENKAYFDTTLGKWVSRIEFESNAKLLSDDEAEDGYVCRFRRDQWNRADMKSRFDSYSIGMQWGILNANECREMEGMNPYDGGDVYMKPLTHGSTDDDSIDDNEDDPPTDDPPTDPDTDGMRSRIAARDLVANELQKAARLLTNTAARAAKREANFLAAVNGLAARHGHAVRGIISPAVRMAAGPGEVDRLSAELFDLAVESFVEASECAPEALPGRVADAGEALRLWCDQTATDLVLERV